MATNDKNVKKYILDILPSQPGVREYRIRYGGQVLPAVIYVYCPSGSYNPVDVSFPCSLYVENHRGLSTFWSPIRIWDVDMIHKTLGKDILEQDGLLHAFSFLTTIPMEDERYKLNAINIILEVLGRKPIEVPEHSIVEVDGICKLIANEGYAAHQPIKMNYTSESYNIRDCTRGFPDTTEYDETSVETALNWGWNTLATFFQFSRVAVVSIEELSSKQSTQNIIENTAEPQMTYEVHIHSELNRMKQKKLEELQGILGKLEIAARTLGSGDAQKKYLKVIKQYKDRVTHWKKELSAVDEENIKALKIDIEQLRRTPIDDIYALIAPPTRGVSFFSPIHHEKNVTQVPSMLPSVNRTLVR